MVTFVAGANKMNYASFACFYASRENNHLARTSKLFSVNTSKFIKHATAINQTLIYMTSYSAALKSQTLASFLYSQGINKCKKGFRSVWFKVFFHAPSPAGVIVVALREHARSVIMIRVSNSCTCWTPTAFTCCLVWLSHSTSASAASPPVTAGPEERY